MHHGSMGDEVICGHYQVFFSSPLNIKLWEFPGRALVRACGKTHSVYFKVAVSLLVRHRLFYRKSTAQAGNGAEFVEGIFPPLY